MAGMRSIQQSACEEARQENKSKNETHLIDEAQNNREKIKIQQIKLYYNNFPWLDESLGWRQDNRNRSNQESKFDFLATRQRLVKIDKGQQKRKIVCSNQQSNLRGSYQSIFSLRWHHPSWMKSYHLKNKVI